MNHLKEEELIDVVMGEPHWADLDRHLEQCKECAGKLATLRIGLEAVRDSKPEVPLMPLPMVSYRGLRHKALLTRLGWVAAAACLLVSLLGLRVEIGEKGFSMAFGRFSEPSYEQRLSFLERNILDIMDNSVAHADLNNYLTANQLEREDNLGDFRENVANRVTDIEYKVKLLIADFQEANDKKLREQELRGKLQ